MSTEVSAKDADYPGFTIEHIHSPSRLWAIPVVGGAVKFVIVFPVVLWLLILQFAASILTIINSFVVLFTGKYWEPAYDLAVGSIRLSTKLNCFAIGLSDAYPGFSLGASDYMKLELPMPSQPSRFFAVPLIGGFVRTLLLIPFFIFLYVIGIVVVVVYWIAWVPVLFAGQYPERLFDFMVYALRLQLRLSAYTFGLTDRYPKFS